VSAGRTWEVIVIDNNSSDDTSAVVRYHASAFPVPLTCVFEHRQGRSHALNAGIGAARGRVLVFTDDDVLVSPEWLNAACDALAADDAAIAYAGGPVQPMWEIPPPAWIDRARGDLWGTIAIQDHGPDAFVYEERRRVPLGANMAATRSLFDRIGLFRTDMGRSASRLVLGQEVPELLLRARDAGLRGLYVPAMQVTHLVPARRLTRAYFRKWWFGKGVSRSRLERGRHQTETGIELRRTQHVFGVPRYMYGSALRHAVSWPLAAASGRRTDAARHQMMLAYFAGYFYDRRLAARPAEAVRAAQSTS
jgi:glycosyltransferase involved in cell wall biosynthesis